MHLSKNTSFFLSIIMNMDWHYDLGKLPKVISLVGERNRT